MQNSNVKLTETEKALVSLKAFLPQDQEICKLIQLCNLQPLKDWRHWTDFLGHNLIVAESKKISIFKEHPLTPTEKIITDIYYKSYPKQITKISKRAIIIFGEEDKHGDLCFIWLIGRDDKLRLVTFAKNQWIENYPPLSCGMKTLRFIVKQLLVEQVRSIDHKNLQGPLACNLIKAWVSPIPVDKNIKLDMLLTNNVLANKILGIF